MQYFDLYQIPVQFFPDEQFIKKQYFVLSKQYHPDFYTNESPEKQAEILATSTEVNKAYQTLLDFDKRMKYILMESGYLLEEEKFVLPQDFLMEMMNLNEHLMEVQMDGDAAATQKIENEVATLEHNLLDEIKPVLTAFSETADAQIFREIKTFYFKRKYLLRIKSQLAGIVDI